MGSATLTPGVRYDMPPMFGPSVAPDVETGFGAHNTTIDFETSGDAIDPLLPRWFRPAERCMLTISYRRMLDMAWMGGRDYQLITIAVTAEREVGGIVETNPFVLAIWESDTAPILAGRELMGAPKLFGEIPAVEVGGADHGFTCSEYGTLLYRGTATDLVEVETAKVERASERMKSALGWYWKYIPGPGGVPDADYPATMRMWTPLTRLWRGKGAIEWGSPDAKQAPYSGRIIDRLRELPVLSEVRSTVFHAENCTLFRNQTVRLDE